MKRAGCLLLAAALMPATAHAQDRAVRWVKPTTPPNRDHARQQREWWWDYPFKAFTQPSQSMLPSIVPGSYMIARKRPAAGIKRGEIVVFQKDRTQWVKRVIGLPGDRIAIVDGQVRLNGKLAQYGPGETYRIPQPLQSGIMRHERLPGASGVHSVLDLRLTPQDNIEEIVVPANRLFLLGDNRDNSVDSRFSLAEGGLETVAFDQVYGVIDRADIVPAKPATATARRPRPSGATTEIVPIGPQ